MNLFVMVARLAIPNALTALESDPHRLHNFTTVLGLIAGYPLTFSGCRISCIEGLRVDDVIAAPKVADDPEGFRIVTLGCHKTSTT